MSEKVVPTAEQRRSLAILFDELVTATAASPVQATTYGDTPPRRSRTRSREAPKKEEESNRKLLTFSLTFLVIASSLVVSISHPALADPVACVADQPPDHYVEWSSEDPYLLLQPGNAAAQSFLPELNVLCTLFLQLYADPDDLGGRVMLNITIREALAGASLAGHPVDAILSSQQIENWDPFLHLVPGRAYYAVVEMSEGSRPLRWYWARASYDRGEAWVQAGGIWQAETGRDFLFATFGFDDSSSYPLPNPAWSPDEWRRYNWKTYPVVATWMDVTGDGKGDIYTFNNSYADGSPVSTDGSVDIEALDRSRMAPVNLSIAFEYTSYLNASDNRSTLRILVDRIATPSQEGSGAWPAWILFDNLEFLPLLFAPHGRSLDALNLTWESTLEENAFRVYAKPTPDNPQGEVWIYIGHFSTQSIVLRGQAPFGPDRPAGPGLIEQVLLLGAATVAVGAVIALLYRRRRDKAC